MSNEPHWSPRVSPTNAPVWGIGCSGVTVATIIRSMSAGTRPAHLIACAAASVARVAVGLVGTDDASLADSRALDDPVVVRVEPGFEVGVGDSSVGDRSTPTDDAGRGRHATRIQATA